MTTHNRSSRLKPNQDSRLADRLVVLALLAVSIFIIWMAWSKLVPGLLPKSGAELQPVAVKLTAGNNQQLVTTDCYALLLPNDFESTDRPKCNINYYARPRKYQYITVAALTNTNSLDDLELVWRQRWLTLGAQTASRESVTWAGRSALRLIERYPQNGEKFVTYLVQLDRHLPGFGGEAITAFELRGWATTEADAAVLDDAARQWQWRF